ncbi:hypothetical protein TSUD_312400 [Trifolium subterraneum]|uniref:Uncharacterized protein n=1 Tax=Trifolium subterraneum TaxID=3900 RepID=A0A2Z6NTS0_TRISU|nr:hypothetical protein TSUD_312400 [Trifolium subterraneum]
MTSFMVVLSKIMVVVIITLTLIQSSSNAQPPPVSTARPLLRDNMNYKGDKFDHRAEDLEDYGSWDPSPVFGGRIHPAPIPCAQEKSF